MAITKVTNIENIMVIPGSPPTIKVFVDEVFDDTEDATLPITINRVLEFDNTSDVTSEDTLVQTIAAAIWE